MPRVSDNFPPGVTSLPGDDDPVIPDGYIACPSERDDHTHCQACGGYGFVDPPSAFDAPSLDAIDFGFGRLFQTYMESAKEGSLCGTSEYMARRIIASLPEPTRSNAESELNQALGRK